MTQKSILVKSEDEKKLYHGNKITVLDKLIRADFLLSFDKHPCRELNLESKTYYLNGLVLAVWNDGTITKDEIEYLSLLNSSFGFEDDRLEEYIEFAQNADSHSIKEMIKIFDTEDIKYSFMMDCMIMAGKNDNFGKEKEAIIDYYFKIMKITNSQVEDLKYLAQKFQEKNGEALGRYFKKDPHIKKSLFEYLIGYYSIDHLLKVKIGVVVVRSSDTKKTKDVSKNIYEAINKANLMEKLLRSVKKS